MMTRISNLLNPYPSHQILSLTSRRDMPQLSIQRNILFSIDYSIFISSIRFILLWNSFLETKNPFGKLILNKKYT